MVLDEGSISTTSVKLLVQGEVRAAELNCSEIGVLLGFELGQGDVSIAMARIRSSGSREPSTESFSMSTVSVRQRSRPSGTVRQIIG